MIKFDDLVALSDKRVEDFHEMVRLGLHCKHGDFVPAVHYPPITKYPPITQEEMFKGYEPPANGLMDVYYHIPFCPKRCIYCHYPSQYGASDCEKDRYIDAMSKEIDIYKALLGMDKIKLRVALAGGGTPTDLTPKQLASRRSSSSASSRCSPPSATCRTSASSTTTSTLGRSWGLTGTSG